MTPTLTRTAVIALMCAWGAAVSQPAQDYLLPAQPVEVIETVPGARFVITYGLCLDQNVVQATDVDWSRAFQGMDRLRLISLKTDDRAGRCSSTHVLHQASYVFEVPRDLETGSYEVPGQDVPFTSVFTEGEEVIVFEAVQLDVRGTLVDTHAPSSSAQFGELFSIFVEVTKPEGPAALPADLTVEPFVLHDVKVHEGAAYSAGATTRTYELVLSFTGDLEGWHTVPAIPIGEAASSEVPIQVGTRNVPLAIPETVEEQLAVLESLQRAARFRLPETVPQLHAGQSASNAAIYAGALMLAAIPLAALIQGSAGLLRVRARRNNAAVVARLRERLRKAERAYHQAYAHAKIMPARLADYYHALRDVVLARVELSDAPTGWRAADIVARRPGEGNDVNDEELVTLYALEVAHARKLHLKDLLESESRPQLAAELQRLVEKRRNRRDPL